MARAAISSIPQTRSGTVLAASSAGACLVFASGAIINVALAGIVRDLNLDAHALQWILNAELLPLAALTLVAGALGDRFGQKQVFLDRNLPVCRRLARLCGGARWDSACLRPFRARYGRGADHAE